MTGAAQEKDFAKALRTLSRSDHAVDQICHKTEINTQILAADMGQYPIAHGTKQLQKIRIAWPINRTGSQDHNWQLRLVCQHRLFGTELTPTIRPNRSGGIAFLEWYAGWTRASSSDATDVQKPTQRRASLATGSKKILSTDPIDAVILIRMAYLCRTSEMKDEVNSLDSAA
jgi:hypothetical protein